GCEWCAAIGAISFSIGMNASGVATRWPSTSTMKSPESHFNSPSSCSRARAAASCVIATLTKSAATNTMKAAAGKPTVRSIRGLRWSAMYLANPMKQTTNAATATYNADVAIVDSVCAEKRLDMRGSHGAAAPRLPHYRRFDALRRSVEPVREDPVG